MPSRDTAMPGPDLPAPDLWPDVTGPVLTVIKIGGGSGTVTSSPSGIDCGRVCSALFTPPTTVTLTARTDNGSDARFAGWGGACSGLQRECTVTVDGPTMVTARFDPIINNLVFLSSVRTYTTDLGVQAYDSECNRLASEAGINNANGDAYVAWLGDTHASVFDRLGKARGFARVDGEPVGDDPIDMVSSQRIYNPINVDETGFAQYGANPALTGVDYNGSTKLTTNCNDWTSASSSATGFAGSGDSGPVMWYYFETGTCKDLVGSVYCFMRTKISEIIIPLRPGRRIFMSNQAMPIGQSAEARCESDKPAGTGRVSVLRSTTTVPASTLIDSSAVYVRPDGIVVGLGSDLIAGKLPSGIWQQGDGRYKNNIVWTGGGTPDRAGTEANTCSDWTSSADVEMYAGANSPVTYTWWHNPHPWSCANMAFVYCIEVP